MVSRKIFFGKMLKHIILLISLFLILSDNCFGLFENNRLSARYLSLGEGCVALSDEASVISSNPSGLGFFEKKQIQASWSQLYGLKELSSGDFYFAYSFGRFGLGLGFNIFGKSDYYQENITSVAFGYRIKSFFSIGLNLKYMKVSFSPTYGSHSILGIDFGATVRINKKAQFGAKVENINKPEIFNGSDDIPRLFKIGLAIFPFENLGLTFDFEDESGYDKKIHFGQEIKVLKQLALRFGTQTSPARYSLGTGFDFEKINIDYAYLSHPSLGATHKVSFSFGW